jgi:predicted MFS family arabinose efflux permease
MREMNNPEPHREVSFRSYLLRTWNHVNRKKVWALFSINILLFVVLYGAFLSYFPIMLKNRLDAGSVSIGLMMSLFSFTTAITSSQLKRITMWMATRKQLVLSFVLYTFAMLLLAVTQNWAMLVLPLLLFGFGHGMLIPGLQNMLVGMAPLSERAGFMSINSMVLRIGQTLGPLLIGLFYMIGGDTWAFIGGAVAASGMLLVWWVAKP